MLKDNGRETIVVEIEKTIKARNQVKTNEDFINYFRKDLSQIQKTNGETAYAVNLESPEMNQVEKYYRLRDQKKERGEIDTILPEVEQIRHKKGAVPIPAPIIIAPSMLDTKKKDKSQSHHAKPAYEYGKTSSVMIDPF